MTREAIRPHPDVSIIIGTYGDDQWNCRGDWLSQRIYEEQTSHRPFVDLEVINVHDDTLANARNHGADLARGSWLVFLDADDYLDGDYCYQVTQAFDEVAGGMVRHYADVLCPMVQGFRADIVSGPSRPFVEYENWKFIEDEPVRPQPTDLIKRNYLPCGAAIWKQTFDRAGGFEDWPVLEDWAFWLRCREIGAEFGVMNSTYMINDDHQRNKHPDIDKIANDIRARYR